MDRPDGVQVWVGDFMNHTKLSSWETKDSSVIQNAYGMLLHELLYKGGCPALSFIAAVSQCHQPAFAFVASYPGALWVSDLGYA